MIINFPRLEAWDGRRYVVSFPADVDEKRILCAISWEALSDNFGGNHAAPIESFHANRARIEAKAERLILQGRFEPDGSILVRSQDGA
jgi:hypothetical protein